MSAPQSTNLRQVGNLSISIRDIPERALPTDKSSVRATAVLREKDLEMLLRSPRYLLVEPSPRAALNKKCFSFSLRSIACESRAKVKEQDPT